jgi:hypothetical protein
LHLHTPPLTPTHPLYARNTGSTAQKEQQQPVPNRSARVLRACGHDIVARALRDQVLNAAPLSGYSVHPREQTKRMSHRWAYGSKYFARATCCSRETVRRAFRKGPLAHNGAHAQRAGVETKHAGACGIGSSCTFHSLSATDAPSSTFSTRFVRSRLNSV